MKLTLSTPASADYLAWMIMTEVKRIGSCDGNLGMPYDNREEVREQ